MNTLRKALSLLLLASGASLGIASVVVTREIALGAELGAFTLLMLPLPFAPLSSLFLAGAGLSVRPE